MSTTEGWQVIEEKLTQVSMTDDEIRIWQALTQVSDSIDGLPQLHPMEEEETSCSLHDFQSRLSERPGLRAMGWPGPLPNNQREREEVAVQGRRNLVKLGMTEAELDIWYALAPVAGTMLELPELYPMQQEEIAHDFHKLQSRLLARPVFRAAGWEGQTPNPEGIPSPQISKALLTALGMTAEEVTAWENLAGIANCMYQLPTVYLWERRETQHDFHCIELRLIARPALRALAAARQGH
jgi:hypothetical protein